VSGNPEADPLAWDWQNEPHHSFPVFPPFPINKLSRESQPTFLKINRNITVLVGETAYLPCRVKNLEKFTVSWIRARDVTVLSVGHLAFSSDARIGVVQVDRPRLSASDWNLSIVNTSKLDEGMYECQVNTEPKINYKVFLSVQDPSDALQKDSPYYQVVEDNRHSRGDKDEVVLEQHISQIEREGFSMFLHDNGCICPKPEIVTKKQSRDKKRRNKNVVVTADPVIQGGAIKYYQSGEEMVLECVVGGGSSLHWTRDKSVISPRTRLGLSLETIMKPEVSRAVMYMREVELADTGNYTCVSDIRTSSVLVVVTGSPSAQSYRVNSSSSAGHDPVHVNILLIFLSSAVLMRNL